MERDESTNQGAQSLWTFEEIAAITGGTWITENSICNPITGVCYYINQIQPGDLVITTSPKSWSSRYDNTSAQIELIVKKGASCIVVDELPAVLPENVPVLLVDSTRESLMDLGRKARDRFEGEVICITGSVGKTTTKEMLKSALSAQAKTHASRANFNILPQLSVTLAQTPKEYECCVLEFAVEEDRTLYKAQMARPHVAVMTNIQESHLNLYDTTENIADLKSILFQELHPGGVVVLNRDMMHYERIYSHALKSQLSKIITYGEHLEADVRLEEYTLGPESSRAVVKVCDEKIEYAVNAPGKYMIVNSLAVLAVVIALNRSVKVSTKTFSHLQKPARRFKPFKIAFPDGDVTVIDDSYNANPASMRASIETVSLMEPKENGKCIAVLGDMSTSGELTFRHHVELAEPLINSKIKTVFAFGKHIESTYNMLPKSMQGKHTVDPEKLIDALIRELNAGDVLLLKGSNNSKINQHSLVKKLKQMKIEEIFHIKEKIKVSDNVECALTECRAKKNNDHVDILFLGDTSFGENYQERMKARGKKNILEEKGYDYCLEKMKEIMLDADMVIVNLETPITDCKKSPFDGKKKYIHWTDVEKAPAALLRHNVSAVNLANNHSFDFGKEGFDQTIKILNKNDIHWFGASSFHDEYKALVTKISSNVGDMYFAVVGSYGGKNGVVNQLNAKKIAAVVEDLEERFPGVFLISSPHWGKNYEFRNEKQEVMAGRLFNANIDLILGHGAHMLQEIDQVNGRWVVYSIGNFMFNSAGRYGSLNAPPYSLVAKLRLYPGEHKKFSLFLYPIVTNNLETEYQTSFVNEEEFRGVCNLFEERKTLAKMKNMTDYSGKDEYGFYFQLDGVNKND